MFAELNLMSANACLFLVLFAAAAAGFAITPLALAWLWARYFSPRKPGPVKNATTNAVWTPHPPAGCNSNPNTISTELFFSSLMSRLFSLLPFAVACKGLSLGACVAMLIFILLLVEGLAWAWAKGVLAWK